ncbi:MAG: phage holin family protein [bacterium]
MLFGLFILWLATAFGLWICSLLIDGIQADSDGDLLLAALILGILNALIRPLITVLTLPLTVLTFGLFAIVVNALMLKLTAAIVPGFRVDSWGSALLSALLMSLFGIAGLIFVQWVLFDAVYWISAVEQF